eukprot:3374478-Prymnesium_polylepis.2
MLAIWAALNEVAASLVARVVAVQRQQASVVTLGAGTAVAVPSRHAARYRARVRVVHRDHRTAAACTLRGVLSKTWVPVPLFAPLDSSQRTMEVEARKSGPLSPLQPGRALSAAR